MSKISVVTRTPNSNGEMPVSVRHTHNGSNFVKATGVVIHKDNFNAKTGKITGLSNAPELNAKIQAVITDVETAVRNLGTVEPLAPALGKAYNDVQSLKELRKTTVPQAKKILGRYIDMLRAELADLENLVALKKAEIKAEEQAMGISGQLVTKYIELIAESKKSTAAKGTINGYLYVGEQVTKFNPLWEMKDVSSETLRKFEEHLIASGFRNLSIIDVVTKLKSVMYHFGKSLSLDVDDIRAFRLNVKKKRNPNVIYLSKEELNDLIGLHLTDQTEIEARDRFVLMSLTGVRLSDSAIKPENIINGELNFSTEKTDTDLNIPISAKVNEILARYGNRLPNANCGRFNHTIKAVCSKVPSLQHEIEIKTYKGKNKPVKTAHPKYSKISAHVARKTFINLALIAGTNPVMIASVVGHQSTDLIMSTYGNKEAGKERLMNLLD